MRRYYLSLSSLKILIIAYVYVRISINLPSGGPENVTRIKKKLNHQVILGRINADLEKKKKKKKLRA